MKFNFFIFSFLILLVGTVFAELPQYSFGSMQASKEFGVGPGNEISTKLYFYNIYGNRATHIKLSIEKPAEWEVIIIPEIRKVDYEVSGVKVSVDENLVVYPSNASEEPGTNTETIEYITSKVGYIGANFVTLTIKVPENEKIGVSKNIKINAVAFWLGQTGNIALEQEREFEYTITTTTEYYEKPYEEEVEKESLGKKVINLFSEPIKMKPLNAVMVGATFILIIVFIILLIVARRKKKK